MVGGLVFLDGIGSVVGGIMCGLGMQHTLAACQFIGYYVIGIPAGISLAFLAFDGQDIGVLALWLGLGLAIATTSVLQLLCLWCHKWSSSVSDATKRLHMH